MEVLQKPKNKTTSDMAMALSGVYEKDWKSVYNRDYCTSMFTKAYLQQSSYGFSLGDQQPMNG
jgi:hypothetical protein